MLNRKTVSVIFLAGLAGQVAANEMQSLGEITVTGTREQTELAETPATVSIVNEQTIDETRPAHPSEIGSRIPGVHISVTGGEGHMTAIRQPITTAPVYLYLEDGIPTRSTGFFNHNALYEVNIPQAAGIEISKGPGTSLYGSDAIGGVINVLTRPAPLKPEMDVSAEVGEYGWQRLLLSGGNTWDNDGLRADVNLTSTDGWRDATDYDRQIGSLRWDRMLESGATLKTLVSSSNIDQQTAGSSRLLQSDYENNPTLNYTPISYRSVNATRLSTAYEREDASSLLSITPYYRDNSMELMPNWSFAYDPNISLTENESYGVLIKHRQDFAPLRTRLVTGVDVDYSPGSRLDRSIDAVRTGNIYTSYTLATTIYDYEVSFMGVSPYAHIETSPTDQLRITAGLRYDHIEYDYDNKLADGTLVINPTSTAFPISYFHPADTKVDYSHLSPKLGATYKFNKNTNGFISYRHAFRVPSEGQLFRPGRATNTVNLEAVKVDSYEVGLRTNTNNGAQYTASLYNMKKRDDILTFVHPDNTREVMNAGVTRHSGVEVGMLLPLPHTLEFGVSASYAKHTYEDWQPDTTTDYSGNEIESAPRFVASTRLGYRPAYLRGGLMELEWERLGSYYTDQANTHKYDGHDLLHLRVSYQMQKHWQWYARVMNITDERYATSAAYLASSDTSEFAPGLPRTVYAGLEYRFE